MSRTVVTRHIDASPEVVFDVVAHIENFQKAIPHIVAIEVLSETQRGVGTRFRETRDMNGRKATTELEVTEYEPHDHVRIVSDTHGCVWDTVFTVTPKDGGSELTMIMDAKPYKLLAKIVTPFITGMIAKAIEGDMDAVKTYCEARD